MFKQIKLKKAEKATSQTIAVISAFNEHFKPTKLWVEMNHTHVLIHVREVDMKYVERVIQSLTERYQLEDRSILHQIEQAINKVKSYGLKGKKRTYVDYNKERKVTERDKKKQQRRTLHDTSSVFVPEQSTQSLTSPLVRDQSPCTEPVSFTTLSSLAEESLVPPFARDQIICADSATLLKKLPNNCVDLVFTSPPYNFGLTYNNDKEDVSDWNQYFHQLFLILDECIRIVKHGGRIAVNIQPLFSDYIPSHHIVSHFLLQRGLIWRSEILWEKNNYNCKYTTWGSWKSPANPYLKYSWEFIEIFCKGDRKKSGQASNADITAEEFKKWVYGKWSIASDRGNKYGHPAMFPEELALRVLKLFSFRGDFVIDPFNGVGTTTVVAKKNGRHYLGIDISPEYCEMARWRLSEL